ncbi:unnamed protein product, partial [Meganyctiphanes norvegica]
AGFIKSFDCHWYCIFLPCVFFSGFTNNLPKQLLGYKVLQIYIIKGNIIETWRLNFKWMMECSTLLVLICMLTLSVEAIEMSAKSCFLYPINGDEPSPWHDVQKNHDTVFVLEHMPMSKPVNITLKKYQSEDTFCLLSIRLSDIRVYGDCVLGEVQTFALDGNIEDKILVLRIHESIFQVSVEDVMVNLIDDVYELNHNMTEGMDFEDLSEENEMEIIYDNNPYKVQIEAAISPEEKLHAAIGCEYSTDDECIMEFGKTILSVKDEVKLMALSNSSELKGDVNIRYGSSEIKRAKPLQLKLPIFDDVDTWEEVATIVPSYMDRDADKDGYIMFIESSLIYSPRSPGLVGTVKDKEFILDFTETDNIRWGVPCPEKPDILSISTAVTTTTTENDAELFQIDGDNEQENILIMGKKIKELDDLVDASQPDLDDELEPESEPESEPETEDVSEVVVSKASTAKSASRHVSGSLMLICIHLLILTCS